MAKKKITFKSFVSKSQNILHIPTINKPLDILKPLSIKAITNKVLNISKPLNLAQNPINNIAPVYTMSKHKKKINFNSVMKEIRKDTRPLGKVLNKIVSQPGDMMKLGAGTLTSLGGSLAMPLAICGVAVVIYLVTKK